MKYNKQTKYRIKWSNTEKNYNVLQPLITKQISSELSFKGTLKYKPPHGNDLTIWPQSHYVNSMSEGL